MSIYCYLKKEPKVLKTYPKKFLGYLSFGLFFLGLIFLANAFWPIISYEVKSRRFIKPQLISPVSVLGESTTVVDYSRPNNWFPTAPNLPPKPSKITHYTLTIHKL